MRLKNISDAEAAKMRELYGAGVSFDDMPDKMVEFGYPKRKAKSYYSYAYRNKFLKRSRVLRHFKSGELREFKSLYGKGHGYKDISERLAEKGYPRRSESVLAMTRIRFNLENRQQPRRRIER